MSPWPRASGCSRPMAHCLASWPCPSGPPTWRGATATPAAWPSPPWTRSTRSGSRPAASCRRACRGPIDDRRSYSRLGIERAGGTDAVGGDLVLQGLGHDAALGTVAEVDDETEDQPDKEPQPVLGRQREHQYEA